jgi:hypothetical protein
MERRESLPSYAAEHAGYPPIAHGQRSRDLPGDTRTATYRTPQRASRIEREQRPDSRLRIPAELPFSAWRDRAIGQDYNARTARDRQAVGKGLVGGSRKREAFGAGGKAKLGAYDTWSGRPDLERTGHVAQKGSSLSPDSRNSLNPVTALSVYKSMRVPLQSLDLERRGQLGGRSRTERIAKCGPEDETIMNLQWSRRSVLKGLAVASATAIVPAKPGAMPDDDRIPGHLTVR